MKTIIKWLCFLYFHFHKNTMGLLFHDEDVGSLRIKFEPMESEKEDIENANE